MNALKAKERQELERVDKCWRKVKGDDVSSLALLCVGWLQKKLQGFFFMILLSRKNPLYFIYFFNTATNSNSNHVAFRPLQTSSSAAAASESGEPFVETHSHNPYQRLKLCNGP